MRKGRALESRQIHKKIIDFISVSFDCNLAIWSSKLYPLQFIISLHSLCSICFCNQPFVVGNHDFDFEQLETYVNESTGFWMDCLLRLIRMKHRVLNPGGGGGYLT